MTSRMYFGKGFLFLMFLGIFVALPLPHVSTVFAFGVDDAVASLGNATIGGLLNVIGSILFSLGGWLVALGGWLFDASVSFALDSSHFQSQGIKAGWAVFRDLANIMFIAVLVYIAIGTILQLGGVSTKKMLITLIVVALLINFSFFFASVVIDTSNILANLFYNEIAPPYTATGQLVPGAVLGERASISGQIIEGLKLSSMLDAKSAESLSWTQNGITKILGAIALLITAFVLLSGAILFVVRIVALMLSLVLAPLAFAAAVLPATERYWKMWLDKLMGNAFVAPVYLLFLFVLFQIIESQEIVTLAKTNDTFASAFSAAFTKSGNYDEVAKIFLNYGIIIGLLLGIHMAAKTIAGGISSLSVKYAGKATGFAIGATAFGLRRTAGRGFQALAGSDKFAGWVEGQEKKGRFRGVMAQTLFQGTKFGAKSTFDVRSGKVGKATSGLSGIVGAEFGQAGGRGGFEAVEKAQIKRRVELGKALAVTPPKSSGEREQEEAVRRSQEALSEEERMLEEAIATDPDKRARLEVLRGSLKRAQKKGNADDIVRFRREIEAEEGLGIKSARENLKTEAGKLKALTSAREEIGKERAQSFAKRETEGFRVFGKEIPSRPFMRGAARQKAVDEFRKGEGELDKIIKRVADEIKKNESQKNESQKNEPPKTP